MADDDNTRPADPDASTADLGKPSSAALPKKIGHYSIKRIIASGGMGTVYLAQQEQPRRVVALKIMKKGIASRSALRRFEYESQILARLKHPNIAQVYEAGTHDDGEGGVPYFAMEYIPNAKTIIEYAKSKKLGAQQRLALFAKVCDAVHHGHQKGIIHRDLKPGNILVDSGGEPKIIDFGVARATDSDMAITTLQTDIGQLIGTLQYMSPEQCEGDPHDLDTRSDVYALGVVLYELLTESLPYDLSHIALHEAARVIREETPAKPSTINKALRGDVETITLKALEKDRERRYSTAADLGRDIQRYINNEPIEARPASAVYLLGRFARRHRAAVGGVAAVFIVLVLATIVSVVFLIQANSAKNSLTLEVSQRQIAEHNALNEAAAAKESEQVAIEARMELAKQLDFAERKAYDAYIYAAGAVLKKGNMSAAKDRLSRAPESLRNWEWFYYAEQFDQSIYTMEEPGGIAYSPDSRRLASGSEDGTIKLWDVITGEVLATLEGHEDVVWFVVFSPDGRRLGTASTDKTVKLWDVSIGKVLATLEGREFDHYSIVFFRDGQLLASESCEDTIKLWDVATGKVLVTLEGHEDKVHSFAISPDGQWFASGSDDHTIKLWDMATGDVLDTLVGHMDKVTSVAFSPDGQRLASGSDDGMIKLWDVATGEELATMEGYSNLAETVTFSPDGRRLASVSNDHETIKLWDVATGDELATMEGHKQAVWSVAFSPDGHRLASGSSDLTIKLWDVSTGIELDTMVGHEAGVHSVIFSPDGRQLASEEIRDRIKLWDVATGEELVTFKGHEAVWSVVFSPDGHRLASVSSDLTIKLWDVSTGEVLATLEAHNGYVNQVAFSPDGRRLAGWGDGTIKFWDVDTGQELASLEGHGSGVFSLAFSMDGQRLAYTSHDNMIKLSDAITGEELVTIDEGSGSTIMSTVFSPDGQRLASVSNTIKLWDVVTGEELATWEGHDSPGSSVVFSPDGQRLASGSFEGMIKLWDVATGEELVIEELAMFGHYNSIMSVVFSPDGQRLASGSFNHTIKLWDVSTGEVLATLEAHNGYVNQVAFSPDGHRLASGSEDGTIKLWDSVSNAARYRERQEYIAAKSMMEPIVDRRLAELDDARLVADAFRDDPALTNLQRHAALNILLKRCEEQRVKKRRDLLIEQIDIERRRAERSDATANDLNSCAWTLLTVEPADLRDPPAALTYALRACELTNFKDPAILETLALAHHLTGDHAKAVETQQNAFDLLPPDASDRDEYEARLARFKAAMKDEAEELTYPGRK